ncbi:DUF3830 family protein [Aestuariibacter halophilus]|uniref:DUF3830 family protein n=1 Tax=Fluctibacter halophilus TaxID=226011 RepID=A0ABS8GA62_9ALTE|nr:DUF3830 family protein [Aestuariibacter halophilus]MCC2617420.1 DUF3830 family protein [Aestuariibacter halophilus]
MKITIAGHVFSARFEEALSPKTCASFRRHMPFDSQVVHVRWSGEAMWIPLGKKDFEVAYEEATTYPTPGQILLFPQGKSETEILIAYGSTRFASKAGTLAGNHFATITSDLDKLCEIGMSTMWEGAKPILFEDD